MTQHLDPTLLPALESIYSLLDQRPAPRHDAPAPAADYHVAVFRMQCERDANLRELMERSEDDARHIDPRSEEQYFLEEQSPSDSAFR